MNIIKINYNNAAIKLPTKVSPTAISYHGDGGIIVIRINDGLNYEGFYTDYVLHVYANEKWIGELHRENAEIIEGNGIHEIGLEDIEIYSMETFQIKIEGYYYNTANQRQNVSVTYTMRNAYRCSESTITSEYIRCNEAED